MGKKKGEAVDLAVSMEPGNLVAGRRGFGNHVDAAALLVEENLAIDEGEERPVATGADVRASDQFRRSV